MKALDLFCGAGGATKGLQNAGFYVVGVDLEAQPRYVGQGFWRGSVLDLPPERLQAFDFIWASPPCQAHTSLKSMHNRKPHIDLIPATRAMLKASGVPYVIENVVGAPLISPFKLCGTMFGLRTDDGTADLHRHRIFEASFPVPSLQCNHGDAHSVIGIYGGHYRNRARKGGDNRGRRDFTTAEGQQAMGIDWMTGDEISQAIPPAYSEWIARAFLVQQFTMKEAA